MLILLFFPTGVTIESISQLGLAFFGLTYDIVPQARAAIFSQIHEICFYGQGGYDWNVVYNMPIWLRRFTHNKLTEHYSKQKEETENIATGGKSTKLIDSAGKVNTPEFLKASQQYKKPAKYK
jgi:hypothetical protein